MSDSIITEQEERTTIRLQPEGHGYILALHYYAPNKADVGFEFRMSDTQAAQINGFWRRVRELQGTP